VNVLSNLGTLGLVEENLGFVLGCLCEAGDLQFSAEFILIFDMVVGKVVRCSNMFKDNLVSSINLSSCDILSHAGTGLNSPHGVVSLFVIHADFLVAGVASKSHGGKGQRVKVEFSFAKIRA